MLTRCLNLVSFSCTQIVRDKKQTENIATDAKKCIPDGKARDVQQSSPGAVTPQRHDLLRVDVLYRFYRVRGVDSLRLRVDHPPRGAGGPRRPGGLVEGPLVGVQLFVLETTRQDRTVAAVEVAAEVGVGLDPAEVGQQILEAPLVVELPTSISTATLRTRTPISPTSRGPPTATTIAERSNAGAPICGGRRPPH